MSEMLARGVAARLESLEEGYKDHRQNGEVVVVVPYGEWEGLRKAVYEIIDQHLDERRRHA